MPLHTLQCTVMGYGKKSLNIMHNTSSDLALNRKQKAGMLQWKTMILSSYIYAYSTLGPSHKC